MERRDVANKSEYGRNIALAQQRMQQTVSGSNSMSDGNGRGLNSASNGLSDGNGRGLNHVNGALSSESHIHPGPQNGSNSVSHDGGGTQGQDPERSANAEAGVNSGHEQPPQTATVQESNQHGFRRNNGNGWAASAAPAFDSAKDIMEALRNKYPNLASELEVKISELTEPFHHL